MEKIEAIPTSSLTPQIDMKVKPPFVEETRFGEPPDWVP